MNPVVQLATYDLEAVLHAMAELVAELGARDVSFGVCDAAVDALVRAEGAAPVTSVHRKETDDGCETYVIESVEVTREGIRFRAQKDGRPPTEEEIGALAGKEAFTIKTELRAVRL